MDLRLDGRAYLVTGGSRGLGFAAAQALVADGARVMLSAPHEATSGTVATTTDEAWRSAFESVFLGAVRLARILAADLDGAGDSSAGASRRSPGSSARPASGSTGCCRSGSPPTGSGNLMRCAEIPIDGGAISSI
jgi:3-oxoacyl-[acyl-carrier protein] reductase